MRRYTTGLISLCFVLIGVVPIFSGCQTNYPDSALFVGKGEKYETIQSAIDASSKSGQYIVVKSGSYKENLFQNGNDRRTNGLGNLKYGMGNFRNDIYPEYKATRRETPEELIPQQSPLTEFILKKLPFLEKILMQKMESSYPQTKM